MAARSAPAAKATGDWRFQVMRGIPSWLGVWRRERAQDTGTGARGTGLPRGNTHHDGSAVGTGVRSGGTTHPTGQEIGVLPRYFTTKNPSPPEVTTTIPDWKKG